MYLTLISVVILILSVIIHEVAHGFVADRLGDPTARLAGRLTLNPLKHIDPMGSIVVPILTSFMGFTFGWAKPVPYNPYNLKNRRSAELLIALAGPVSNLLLAIIFALAIRAIGEGISVPTLTLLAHIVFINIVLAIFNLIPLPPLDGSKIFFSLFPEQYGRTRMMLESYAPLFILVVVFLLWKLIAPVVPWLFTLFTGINL